MANENTSTLNRNLIILEDEKNPRGSKTNTVYPSTILDQVFDQNSPTNKTLRSIIAELREEILTASKGNIVFPVTSVNGYTEDVELTKDDIGLSEVDNTSDINKPLSDPQRTAIMDILANYNYKVDLKELHNHIHDTSNPHGITIDMINKNGQVNDFVQKLVTAHNNSVASHNDIRKQIANVESSMTTLNNAIEQRLGNMMNIFNIHTEDRTAHSKLFEAKENVDNKLFTITDNTSDHTHYPSARAMVDYVTTKLVEFKTKHANVENWIDDIVLVDTRSSLPPANYRSYRKAYFIRYGNDCHEEIAICRKDPNGYYSWEISSLGSYSKFNPEYFYESPDGVTLSITPIAQEVAKDSILINALKSKLDTVIPKVLTDYYTKDQIDARAYLRAVTIVPGTQDGTIRYYINNNKNTMSTDIKIGGLQRLAFLEWITENELADQSVHPRHLRDRAVEARHVSDKAIKANNLKAGYMTILANFEDPSDGTVKEVSVHQLAATLKPYLDALNDQQ